MHYDFIKIFLLFFILFLFTACESLTASKIADCSYMAKVSKDNLEPEFENQGICGEFFDEDILLIYSKHFDNMDFSEDNLSSLYTDHGMFYVSKSGDVVRTFFFDNGADHFKEGLTRTIKRQKFGFINKELKVVILPTYDFAFPFQNGKAVVCNGCKEEKEEHGEHMKIVDGKWGVINKEGKVIVPLVYDAKEVYKKIINL